MLFLLPPDRGAVRGAARAALVSEWMTQWLGVRVEVSVAAEGAGHMGHITHGAMVDAAIADHVAPASSASSPR